jgi:hypothetical protein
LLSRPFFIVLHRCGKNRAARFPHSENAPPEYHNRERALAGVKAG